MTASLEVKKIVIPGFVKKLPYNIVNQLIRKEGNYRLQRSIGEHLRNAWKTKVPLYFHRRTDLQLPVTHQFEKAMTYKITSHSITFSLKPCHGSDGFNYVHSLMKGKRGIEGRHFVPDKGFDCLVPRGNVRPSSAKTFERLMSSIKTTFTTGIGEWSKKMLDRAIHAAGGK